MEEFDSIQVDRPVFSQFQTILLETQLTSNNLMKYFFKLYKRSLKRTSFENCDQVASNGILHDVKGDYFNKLVVNIPRKLLRQDISVSVTVPDFDPCNRTDSDSSEDGSTPRPLIVLGKMENENVEKKKTTLRYYNHHQLTYSCKQCIFKTKGFRKFQRHTRKHENQHNSPKLSNHIKDSHENEEYTKNNCNAMDKNISIVQISNIDIEMDTPLSDTNNSLTLNQNDISNQGEINLNQYSIRKRDNFDNQGEITHDLCAVERGDNKVTNAAAMGKLSAKTENNLAPVKNKISMENGYSKSTSSIQGIPYGVRKKRIKNKGIVNKSPFQQDFGTCDYPKTQGKNKIFNCKCKKKFKWKSLFLCHKKSCGYVKMLKQRSGQKNGFIKISGRPCKMKENHHQNDPSNFEMRHNVKYIGNQWYQRTLPNGELKFFTTRRPNFKTCKIKTACTMNIHDTCTKNLRLDMDSLEPLDSRNKHINSKNSCLNGADMKNINIPTNNKLCNNLNETDINSVRKGNDDSKNENVSSSAERYENLSANGIEENHRQNDPSNFEMRHNVKYIGNQWYQRTLPNGELKFFTTRRPNFKPK